MKLRQKLAAVLAATMILTAVPVVTMAATEVTNPITASKDSELGNRAPDLKVDVAYDLTSGSEFYIKLEGGKFAKDEKDNRKPIPVSAKDKDGKDIPGLTIEAAATSDKQARVKVNEKVPGGSIITVGLDTVIIKDDVVKVSVDANETTVKAASDLIVATAGEAKKVVITAGDAVSIYGDRENMPAITFEETVVGQFAAITSDADRKVTITLDNTDYEFAGTTQTLTIKGQRGFAGQTDIKVTATVDKNDAQEITFTLPNTMNNTLSRGALEVTGLDVKATTKSPTTGDLKADVKFGDTTTNVKLANIAEYGVTIEMKDKKVLEFKSGKENDIEFTIKETVRDTIADGRIMEIKLDKGKFISKPSVEDINSNDITEIKDDDKNIIGIEFKAPATDKVDKYVVKGKIAHDLSAEDVEMNVTVSGRAVGGETSALVAKVSAPVTVKAEGMTLSVGQAGQEGGKIVITETDKGMIDKGDLVLKLGEDNGISFKKADLKVEAEGFKAGKPEIKKVYKPIDGGTTESSYELRIPISRSSKEAGSITISGLNVTVDRTVPQGTYDLKIGGSAIAKHGDLKVKDFFTIGTPNEDSVNGLKKGTTTFTINTTKYVVNGVEKTLDAAPYVSTAGRTMIPVRALADAFGVEGKDIVFSNGTIVIFAGSKTIELQNGSNIAKLNGIAVAMDEKVTIKDGRTYAPASRIGNLLGVEPTWDQATQTASFTNK